MFLHDLINHQIQNSLDRSSVSYDKNIYTFQLLYALLSLTDLAKSVDQWWTKQKNKEMKWRQFEMDEKRFSPV